MKIFALTTAFWFFTFNSFSQSTIVNSNIPKVIPNSPTISAINKYGNYTVNLFHGLPEISIPLYEIKVGEISVPISISYHASGIKVNDWGTSVGTGWVLNAGGNVAWNVKDIPDAVGNNSILRDAESVDPANNWNDYYFLKSIDQGCCYDSETDIFSYKLPVGKSGNFILNKKDNLKPILIPKEPIKVEMLVNGSAAHFKLTTDEGIVYNFKDRESMKFTSGSSTQKSDTYLLTNIYTPNKTDSVRFKYIERTGISSREDVNVVSVDDKIEHIVPSLMVCLEGNYSLEPYTSGINSSISNTYTYMANPEKIPSEILFPNGKVVFVQSSENRLDVADFEKKLSEIKIYRNLSNSGYELIKSIKFNQSYFMQGNDLETYRLRLDNIQVKNNNETKYESYSFEYNTNTTLPKRNSKSVDYWGYFNNYSNWNLVPNMDIDFIDGVFGLIHTTRNIGGANRSVNPLVSQAYMIKKINYPTGGYTEFEFENNKYFENGTEKLAGGHRIKQIKSMPYLTGLPILKHYKYGVNENGYGRANFSLDYKYFYDEKEYINLVEFFASNQCYETYIKKRNRQYSSNPLISLVPLDGSPITYEYVTEYSTNTNNGKIGYKFSDTPDEIIYGVSSYPGLVATSSNHISRGLLLEKNNYKSTTNNYILTEKTENNYHSQTILNFVDLSFKWKKRKIYDVLHISDRNPCLSNFQSNYYPDFENGCHNDKYSYAFMNIPFKTGDQKLIETKTTTYDVTDPQKTITSFKRFSYDNNNYLQPTSFEEYNGKNQLIKSEYKYAYHADPSNSVYSTMVHFNKISLPIESKQTNITINKELVKVKTDYGFWYNSSFTAPSSFKKSILSNALETESTINNYDIKGNIIQMIGKDGILISYLYGYQSQYLVAKIVNTSSTTVSGYVNQSVLDNAIGGLDDLNMRVYLNSLRAIPNSFVTTYTYKPLIGISSETDPNGRTKYYEYDNFNRLSIIRDHDNNILKKICYNYAGQVEDCNTTNPCPPNSPPNWQNTTLPPTCEQLVCGFTGNQLQQQMDMNTCSPTSGTTRVIAIPNQSACPVSTTATITYNNSTGSNNFTATYTHRTTGQVYTFTVPASGSGVLGCLPAGTYSLSISRPGEQSFYLFSAGNNCFTQSGSAANFWKIQVPTCSNVTIHWEQ